MKEAPATLPAGSSGDDSCGSRQSATDVQELDGTGSCSSSIPNSRQLPR